MLYLGIDNGATGAIAALAENGSLYRVDKMPPTDAELLGVLRMLAETPSARDVRTNAPAIVAVLEHAHSMPKQGHVGAFTYGKGYGAMQMALHAAAIPFDIVAPAKWQAALGCRSGGDKNITKRRAEQLFPKLKVTHAIADALLIAEYCRRKRLGI